MQIHINKVGNSDPVGFSLENAKGGGTVKVETRALITSDDANFYSYSAERGGRHQFSFNVFKVLKADSYRFYSYGDAMLIL